MEESGDMDVDDDLDGSDETVREREGNMKINILISESMFVIKTRKGS